MTLKILLAVLALALPTSVGATTLTFDGDICDGTLGGTTACNNGEGIVQTYGDGVGVDVTYDNGSGQSLLFWTGGYSGLTNVAYGGTTGTITIAALAGFQITLNGFDLGAWPNANRNSQVTVSEIGGGTLLSTGPITVLGSVASSFGPFGTSTSGFVINFGPDAFNVGIDNISFDVSSISAPIPLPAGAVLLLGGLAGLAALRRRRPA